MPDFSETINAQIPAGPTKELTTSFPTSGAAATPDQFTVRYGQYVIGEEGNAELEKIIGDCLSGKMVLARETWNFTKTGETIVTIKYLIPKTKDTAVASPVKGIQGVRRLRKLEAAKEK